MKETRLCAHMGPWEVFEMTEVAQGRVFRALPTVGTSKRQPHFLKKRIIKLISEMDKKVVTLAKRFWNSKQGKVLVLAGADEALRTFATYDWGSEGRKHTSSITSIMSKTTTAASSSSEPAASPTLYWFRTKEGTDLSTFESYIKTLPDNGVGFKVVFPRCLGKAI